MFVDVEDLKPGSCYELDGKEVVFEGVGRERRYYRPALGFRELGDPEKTLTIGEPKVSAITRDLGEYWRNLRRRQDYLTQSVVVREITMGSDPEFFVEMAREGTREVVPAFEVYPRKSLDASIFWDGFQGEFTVESSHCLELLSVSVKSQLEKALRWASARTYQIDPARPLAGQVKASILPRSVISLTEKELVEASDEQVALGCKPSENVYGMQGLRISNPRDLRYRFAGGHVHLGFQYPYLNRHMLVEAVKCMDMLAGIPSVVMAQDWDDPIRRRFYGQAGEFRTPKHGLEYRTLSNFWLREPAMLHLIVGLVRGAANWGLNGWRGLFEASEAEVVEIVQNSDVEKAQEWLRKRSAMFKRFLVSALIAYPNKTFDVLVRKRKFDFQSDLSRWGLYDGSRSFAEKWHQRMEKLNCEIGE